MLTVGDSHAIDSPNTSGAYTHEIFITSNNKLDEFVSGNGTTGLTLESAHIIENFSIHTSTDDFGIFIQNVDRFLIIRNCSVYATDTAFSEKSGIEIQMSYNIIIENCTVSYHKIGINFIGSHNSIIRNSTVFHNHEAGIKLLESDHNVIDNNVIKQNLGYGIFLKRSHENTITNNIIEENLDLGIYDRGNENVFEDNSCEPVTSKPIFSKTWLWVVLGVGGVIFFIGGLMFFVTWRGR
jgi:parallel beta-helix repeat protein